MIEELFLPDHHLGFEEIEITPDTVIVKVASVSKEVICPHCQKAAYRLHSQYFRKLDDLPCGERRVQILWRSRRYFCDNHACAQITFCEQVPKVARHYGRKTTRLQEKQTLLGYELGGEMGKRLANLFNIHISSDQILRFVKSKPEPKYTTPRVLGIDDWAKRKGRTYGTILVDLEKQEVIDLLLDRKPETVAAWLSDHPGVEIISRDRGTDYIEGIEQSKKDFIEVADRFHLLKNMVEMLQRLFERCPGELEMAARQNSSNPTMPPSSEGAKEHEQAQSGHEPETQNRDARKSESPHIETGTPPQKDSPQKSYRQVQFAEVKSLAEQGLSQRAIAEKIGLDRRTVHKYLNLSELPQKHQPDAPLSKAAPYMEFIKQHWDPKTTTVKEMLSKVQGQGFSGSYASLNRAIHSLEEGLNLRKSRNRSPKSIRYHPKQTAWAIFQAEQELTEFQKALCKSLCELSPLAAKARVLAHDFRDMIKQKKKDDLDEWMLRAENSQIPEFARFAAGLRSDYKAVKAALTYSWSNGQVEGQVNRLKMIKRQMYGRAGFLLLRKRVLGYSPASPVS